MPTDRTGGDGGGAGGFRRSRIHPHRCPAGRRLPNPENQAAYALSQADLAAQLPLDQHPNTNTAPTGAGWRFQADGEPSRRCGRPRTGCGASPGGAHQWSCRPHQLLVLSVAVPSDGVDHVGQAPIAPFGQSPQFVQRCRVRAVMLGPGDQLPPVDREGKPIEHVTKTLGGISHRQSRPC